MKSSKPLTIFLMLIVLGFFSACGGGGGGGSSSSSSSTPTCAVPAALSLPNGSSVSPVLDVNVLTLTVNGSTCSAATSASYPNKPCVTVTICDTNGTCKTINDILLDTGDYGLRIFQSTLSGLSLGTPPSLYECIEYGDGSTVWGPVETLGVKLGDFSGGEPTVSVPIQLIGSTTSDIISGGSRHACPGQLPSPTVAGYNGSLGLGFHPQDCGIDCQTQQEGIYFTCNGTTCTGTTVATTGQVTNPVFMLPVDNNGVIVSLPTVPSAGASSATGYLILGIGTGGRSNNAPSGVTAYGVTTFGVDAGYLTTNFNGVLNGFLDTGSNGIFFADSAIPTSKTSPGFYAPSCTLSLAATNTGTATPQNTGAVNFQIANADSLFSSSNNVFFNLGGPTPDSTFDWGLPFFLGRNVFIGIQGRSSSLGAGPYWAY